MTPFCQADIRSDEGCRLHAYEDTVGVCTIGYGHAGVKPGTVWTQQQADQQFIADVDNAIHDLSAYLPWWTTLNDARQDVLVNMTFNLGIHGLLAFRSTLQYAHSGRFETAGADMLNSVWARQVSRRADRLSKQMSSGVRVAP